MPWSGEDDECGRGSDGPAGTDSSAGSPKAEQRSETEEAGKQQGAHQGALYASRSSAKAATAVTVPGRRKKEGKNEVFSFPLPNPPQDA